MLLPGKVYDAGDISLSKADKNRGDYFLSKKDVFYLPSDEGPFFHQDFMLADVFCSSVVTDYKLRRLAWIGMSLTTMRKPKT